MKYIVILSLFILWFCDITRGAPKHVILRDNFTFSYKTSKGPLGIVGGQEASPHQFPYQVGLYIDTQMDTQKDFCGGSLISATSVLTAAHCVERAISIELIFGAKDILDIFESTRQRQTSSNYVIHPNWDNNTITGDLAIIKLSQPVTLNQYVQIVKFADGGDTYAGVQGTIIGWGKTDDSQQSLTSNLRYATNNVLSNDQCKAADPSFNAIIQNVHLCLSGDGNKGICMGDSGGPIVSNGVQIGIGSFNYRSCDASKPSVFVRLTEYAQWIKDNMN